MVFWVWWLRVLGVVVYRCLLVSSGLFVLCCRRGLIVGLVILVGCIGFSGLCVYLWILIVGGLLCFVWALIVLLLRFYDLYILFNFYVLGCEWLAVLCGTVGRTVCFVLVICFDFEFVDVCWTGLLVVWCAVRYLAVVVLFADFILVFAAGYCVFLLVGYCIGYDCLCCG